MAAFLLLLAPPLLLGAPAIAGVLNFLASFLAVIFIGVPAVSDFPVAVGDSAFSFLMLMAPC